MNGAKTYIDIDSPRYKWVAHQISEKKARVKGRSRAANQGDVKKRYLFISTTVGLDHQQ
jgi:hypothetical protein